MGSIATVMGTEKPQPVDYTPLNGAATVNGILGTGEWDLDYTSVPLLRAGNGPGDGVSTGNVWLKWDHTTSTLYFLVLTFAPIDSNDQLFATVVQSGSGHVWAQDDLPPAFFQISGVNLPSGYGGGCEASCYLAAPGEYTVEVNHINGEPGWFGSSACAQFAGFNLFVVPEYALGGLMALGACFAAFLAIKRIRQPSIKLR